MRRGENGDITFWNSLTGCVYALEDENCPLQDIWLLVSSEVRTQTDQEVCIYIILSCAACLNLPFPLFSEYLCKPPERKSLPVELQFHERKILETILYHQVSTYFASAVYTRR